MLIWTVTWLIVANARARFFLLLLFSKVTESWIGNFYNTKANNEHFTARTMASVFSGVLQLTDLDDFITPSQVTKLLLHATTTYYLYHENTVIGKDPYRRTVVNGNVRAECLTLSSYERRTTLFVKELKKREHFNLDVWRHDEALASYRNCFVSSCLHLIHLMCCVVSLRLVLIVM